MHTYPADGIPILSPIKASAVPWCHQKLSYINIPGSFSFFAFWRIFFITQNQLAQSSMLPLLATRVYKFGENSAIASA